TRRKRPRCQSPIEADYTSTAERPLKPIRIRRSKMIKSGFSYLKWTAVVAVLAITIIAGVRPSTATKQPTTPAAAVPSADLANEERALAKYHDDLITYNYQTAQLSAKAKLVSADLDPLQRRSDELKGGLSGLQNV